MAAEFEPPRHASPPKNATSLQIEALFWAACASKPFSVEYGNDMPGSGFASPEELGQKLGANANDVGETEWNMRVAPRARGSLLRAMGRDVAGVTSPMLYVAMLYSWFAWHVEDHELHSLNFLHFGKPKTWYGVPRDAMLAFEETVRVHGYADDLNAIMAFQTLNEKTTVLSPEVLLSAGVPCCRLVQKAGEFVITFPGAYHSGFSHGFNCGEASNIATPHWLQVAKEAAIRRASTNCGPMVSHYQLLYELALSLRPREPNNFHFVRSSRLRDKNKNEGDIMVKENFVGSVTENNNLLSVLLDKNSCIIVPKIAFPISSFRMALESEVTAKQKFTAGPSSISQQGAENMAVDHVSVDKASEIQDMSGSIYACDTSFVACSSRKLYETKYGKKDAASLCLSTSEIQSRGIDNARLHPAGGILDQGRLPCVQCGILSFACVAIIQPREAAVQFIMSKECISSSANHGEIGASDDTSNWINRHHEIGPPPGIASETEDNVKHTTSLAHVSDQCEQLYGNKTDGGTSALGLLASAYDSSDSDEETAEDVSKHREKNDSVNENTNTRILETSSSCSSMVQCQKKNSHLHGKCEARDTSLMEPVNHNGRTISQCSRDTDFGHFIELGKSGTHCSGYLDLVDDLTTSVLKPSSDTYVSADKASMDPDVLTMLKYNKESCRMHVFCLEHALETWTQLQKIGGANIMLLCHPEYPRAESAAKVIAEELGVKHDWKDVNFKEATEEDIRKIQLALQDEDAEPTGSDWAVKMGINIYYSAKQSKSPLYSKQIPYNSIIYKAFGQENPDSLTDYGGQKSGSAKKKVAGWWCGKVWMSNQVHPLLARQREEQNGSTGYSKITFAAISHAKVQDEPSTRCNTLINRSLSKRTSRRKGMESAEKSKEKKKKTTASNEASIHYNGPGINSEVISDQLENSDDHDKYDKRDEIEEETNPQIYQQHKLQNVTRKSVSRKRKDEKRKDGFHELYGKDNDVDYLVNNTNMGSGDDATLGNSDNTQQQSLDPVKVKSGGKLQGNKRKSSKCKSSDDLLNEDNKLQKMNKKSSSKKQKNDKINRQFQGQNEDDHLDHLLDVEIRDVMPENEDKITEDKIEDAEVKSRGKLQSGKSKTSKRQARDSLRTGNNKLAKFPCDIEGCDMSFSTQQDLLLHKRDICPVKGCKKKFFCHKYLLQHRKVHIDERPLKCMWKGCKKAFKWPWARTEHMRVHTGVRPYECKEPGCGQTFRFVSDFSRHKRKTGHSSDKRRKNST
uniref:JmjC domain-containing protein n=1 Tax=Leersia perrieri TaxID=77586 RepID=A0A0D9XYG9_9ORYZ